MIDSLLRLLPEARRRGGPERLGLEPGGFALVTLHRPALTDRPAELLAVLTALDELARDLPVVFPLHPRTRARLAGLAPPLQGVRLIDPLPYLDFIALEAEARLVVTDSGGVQEETSVLGVPCLTYRTSTERPVTLRLGTNRLVGTDPEALRRAALDVLAAPPPPTPSIPLWDGAAGARAAQEIERLVGLA
jgi:UDP-N-acetylglucosamine 2-epimerase (non-hydrolysing)